jgi:hypothetical protein
MLESASRFRSGLVCWVLWLLGFAPVGVERDPDLPALLCRKLSLQKNMPIEKSSQIS